MADNRKDLPPVTSPNFLDKVREALSVYLGNRGDVLNRGVTLRDLVDGGMATLNGRWGANGSGSPLVPVLPPVDPATGPYVIDLTPPPMPSGFAASAAISNIFVECAAQTYTQGHGHAKSILYGATYVSGPLPVFADAVVLTEFQGGVFAYATNPATTWHLWLKWQSVDGVQSVNPAGGTNGLTVTTGQDVAPLLEALSGKITTSELYSTLNSRIDLIDAPATAPGSVAYQVAAEAAARSAAIVVEALARANAVTAESDARVDAVTLEAIVRTEHEQAAAYSMLSTALTANSAALSASSTVAIAQEELFNHTEDGIAAEAGKRLLLAAKLDAEKATTLALITAEEAARVDAVSAEASSRDLLAAQFRGTYTGTNPALLTQGLLYNERIVRTTQEEALSQQITLLSAGAGEQFDWAKIWYFDNGLESWTGNGVPTATAGWIRPADQAANAYIESPTGIATDGAKYSQLRLRIRKVGAPVFLGSIQWCAATDSTWDVPARTLALPAPAEYIGGIGLITVNPGWAVTVDKIRISLSSAQTATDYFELDWVAIGRPSPGASSAQLLAEQTARVNADGALADDYVALNAKVGDATTGIVKDIATIVRDYSTTVNANSATAQAQTTLLAHFGPSMVFRDAGTAQVTGPDTNGPAQVINYTAITLKDGSTAYLPKISLGNTWYNSANNNKPHTWNGIEGWIYTPDLSPTATNAYISNLETALATPTTAVTNAIKAMESVVLDPVTGQQITLSTLNTEQKTFSDLTSANAKDVRTLRSESKLMDELVLKDILNGEAAKDAYTGSLALAREELTTHIVDGLLAEANKTLALTAVVGANAATLTQEQSTRASQTDALSQNIVTLTSTVSDNLATLTNDYYTKTDTNSAIGSATTALASTVGNNLATALTSYSTTADANSATASAQTTLLATYGANSVFRQPTGPIQSSSTITLANGTTALRYAIALHDLWFDTSDGNKPYTCTAIDPISHAPTWTYNANLSAEASSAYITSLDSALASSGNATISSWRDKVAKVDTPESSLSARLRTDYNAIVSTGGVLATNASYLRASANLGAKTFTGTTAPTKRGTHTERTVVKDANGVDVSTDTTVDDALMTGDIWIDTTLIGDVAGNKQNQWNGTAWVYSPDLSIATVDARVTTVETTKIGYATKGGVVFDNAGGITTAADVTAWNVLNPTDLATWHIGLPLSSAVKQVAITTVDPTTGSSITGIIEDRMTAVATTASKMYLEKAVRIGSGGSVVGYGLSGHVSAGEPVVTDSMFIANVDTFAVTIPISSVLVWAPSTVYAAGALVKANADGTSYPTQYLQCIQPGTSGSSGAGLWGYAYGVQITDNTVIWQTVSRVPFSVAKATTTVDGVSIPTGTFMDGAYIRDATITNAKIHDLKADKITTGTLTAALGIGTGLLTSQAVAGKTAADFALTWNTTSGFYLDTSKFYIGNGSTQSMTWDGTNFTVKGTVYASSGNIGGNTITSAAISSPNFSTGTLGWTLKNDGHVEFGAADIRGQLTASQIDTRGLSIKDAGGTVILAAGTALTDTYITPASGWLNSNITGATLTGNGVWTSLPASGATVGADSTNLNVGVGKNRIANSGPAIGSKGACFIYTSTTSGTTELLFSSGTGPTGQGGVAAHITGTTTTGQYLFLSPHTDRFPVEEGKYYEASAFVACYAMTGNVTLAFYNSSDTLLSETLSTISVTTNHAGQNMSSWPRPFVIVQAPPTAATARMCVKGVISDASGNYYLTISSCYFGEALVSQTVPSPWADGGISHITASNASTYIADLAVDTLQIAGNAVSLPYGVDIYVGVATSTYDELTNTLVTSLDITSTGAPAIINVTALFSTTVRPDATYCFSIFRLYLDDSQAANRPMKGPPASCIGSLESFAQTTKVTCTPGAHTLYLYINHWDNGTSGSSRTSVEHSSITYLEVKK